MTIGCENEKHELLHLFGEFCFSGLQVMQIFQLFLGQESELVRKQMWKLVQKVCESFFSSENPGTIIEGVEATLHIFFRNGTAIPFTASKLGAITERGGVH